MFHCTQAADSVSGAADGVKRIWRWIWAPDHDGDGAEWRGLEWGVSLLKGDILRGRLRICGKIGLSTAKVTYLVDADVALFCHKVPNVVNGHFRRFCFL